MYFQCRFFYDKLYHIDEKYMVKTLKKNRKYHHMMIIPIFYYNCLIILIIVSLQLSIAARKNAAAQPSKPSPIEGRIMDIANRILAILIAIA